VPGQARQPAFVGKAPEQVVAKIKDRLATAEADLRENRAAGVASA
jgi:valyl-tRNA synthetase